MNHGRILEDLPGVGELPATKRVPTRVPKRVRGQQHPIGLYFKIWGCLFVLSAMSYMVDYFNVEGYPRWTLILLFMLLKAGLIVSVFMHMMWERLALLYAILLPPLAVLVFVLLMMFEGDYTTMTRTLFFGAGA